jgi:hypothetical protein
MWEKIPGTDTERYRPVTDPRSMSIGLALLGVFTAVLLTPWVLSIDVSGDSPVAQVTWVALLLSAAILACTFLLRGRGVRR